METFSVDISLLTRLIKDTCLSQNLPMIPLLQLEPSNCCIKLVAQAKPSFKALLAWHRVWLPIAAYPVVLPYIPPASRLEFQQTLHHLTSGSSTGTASDFPQRFIFLNKSNSNVAKEILPLLSVLCFPGCLYIWKTASAERSAVFSFSQFHNKHTKSIFPFLESWLMYFYASWVSPNPQYMGCFLFQLRSFV